MPMKEQLRRLLEPAQTSPINSFKWRDTRPIRKQVASGLRITAGLFAGFTVIVAALGAIGRLSDHQQGLGLALASWAALAITAIVMLWTANRWAPWVLVFFAPALLKILPALVFEQNSYFSSHSTSRLEVAEFLAYALAVVLLTTRFMSERPAPTTFVDRIALTVFVLAQVFELIHPNHFLHWPLLVGLAGLLSAWCVHRRSHLKHKRTRRRTERRATSVAS